MIELHFLRGTSLRKVFIKGRKITIITPESGFQPLSFDLNKMEEKMSELEDKITIEKVDLDHLRTLITESDIAKDIKEDYKKQGWRLIKKDV